jgi:hypothetical protein
MIRIVDEVCFSVGGFLERLLARVFDEWQVVQMKIVGVCSCTDG